MTSGFFRVSRSLPEVSPRDGTMIFSHPKLIADMETGRARQLQAAVRPLALSGLGPNIRGECNDPAGSGRELG